MLVGVVVWRNLGPGHWVNYIATFTFVAGYAVARTGIWAEAAGDAEPDNPSDWRDSWLWGAAERTVNWFGSFMIISVLGAKLVDHIENFPRT
ncbi:hypothetical protein [Nocardia sp. XZ_19_385]|uniref:hypothetical protein n=1 Tax=Nocardia sp. XZ_19_385 TaxID=2769488 RepID=UPI00188FC0EE|nr:hypothetical protein [Nocardia sp. XZ_19_385]